MPKTKQKTITDVIRNVDYWIVKLNYTNGVSNQTQTHFVVISESPDQFIKRCKKFIRNTKTERLEVDGEPENISFEAYTAYRNEACAEVRERRIHHPEVASNGLERRYLRFFHEDKVFPRKEASGQILYPNPFSEREVTKSLLTD